MSDYSLDDNYYITNNFYGTDIAKAKIEKEARISELEHCIATASLAGFKNVEKFCRDRIKELKEDK